MCIYTHILKKHIGTCMYTNGLDEFTPGYSVEKYYLNVSKKMSHDQPSTVNTSFSVCVPFTIKISCINKCSTLNSHTIVYFHMFKVKMIFLTP